MGITDMSDELVTLASFASPVAAELAKIRLGEEGIPAMLSGDNAGGLFGGAVGLVHLLVAEKDCQRAAGVLAEFENEELETTEDKTTAIKAKECSQQEADDDDPDADLRVRSVERDIVPGPGRPSTAVGAEHAVDSQDEDEDEEDDDLEVTYSREALATRALRVAVIGLLLSVSLVVTPLIVFFMLWYLYVLGLVRQIAKAPGSLSEAGRWKVILTLTITVPILAICALMILAMMFGIGFAILGQ
jgi:hypothetical protein